MEIQTYEIGQALLPPADLAREIERLKDDLSIERDRNLRTLADFKNYRRRVERDAVKHADEGKRVMILSLLDIVDDLEKALQWTGDAGLPVVNGVRIIQKKLFALLEAQGVRPFDSSGTAFNHERHEAVALARQDRFAPGVVIDELRRGYLWNNELLRAAQVRVAE